MAGAMLALGSCAPSDESKTEDVGDVTTLESALYLTGQKWPADPSTGTVQIPVCFDQNVANATTHFADNAMRTRNLVMKTWSSVAKIDFTGWGNCGTNRNGIIVVHLVTFIQPPSGETRVPSGATSPIGYPGATGTTDMQILCGTGGVSNEAVDAIAVVHEFGHALGFAHEMDRPDYTLPCAGKSVVNGGNYLDTPSNDTKSIMASGYCGNTANLSFWDIWGAHVAYGTRYGAVTQLATAYSPTALDYATVSTIDRGGLNSGYNWSASEGWLFTKQAPQTVPLRLYWSPFNGDYFTTATTDGINSAIADGYGLIGTEGYVYPTEQPGTIPLKLYWSAVAQDYLTTAIPDQQMAALSAGYEFIRIEGYLFGGYAQDGYWVGSQESTPYITSWRLVSPSGTDNISLGTPFTLTPGISAAADLLSNGYQVVQGDAAFLRYNWPGTSQAKIFKLNSDYAMAATPQDQSALLAAGYTVVPDAPGFGGTNTMPEYLFTSQYDYSNASNVIPYQHFVNSVTGDHFTTATAAAWASSNSNNTNVGIQGFGLAQDTAATAFIAVNGFYDGGTQCTVGGITMHCCPNNSAMIGANLGTNVFKCVSTSLTGTRTLATSPNPARCGSGKVMVGFHAALNTALCQTSTQVTAAQASLGVATYDDRCTYDSSSMHVCPFIPGGPYTGFLGGINQPFTTFVCLNRANRIPAILTGPVCNPFATQTSDFEGFDDGAQLAVDGNTDGDFWHGSVTHTNNNFDETWTVDLGAVHTITGVTIFNRTDCCSERLAPFNLEHLETSPIPHWPVDVAYSASTLGVPSISLNIVSVSTQSVRIRKPNNDFLSLAEVQVMGF